jgi:hypothetical protein
VGKTPTVGIILRPRPKDPRKFNGIFVNILFKNQVTVTKVDNKQRKKSPTESKEEKKVPVNR